MTHYLDIFDEIIDTLRATGDITGISEDAGITTVTSANSLSVGEYIILDDDKEREYMIKSADATEFTIEGTDIVADTWKALAPYYMFDTPKKMVNALSEKETSKTLKYQKYPLIYLKLNNPEKKNVDGFYAILNSLLFVLMIKTKINYVASERKTISFDPILNPLADQFIEAIDESTYFNESGASLIYDHEENYYWGTEEGINAKSILNDIVDAVELNIEKLSIHKTCES